MIIKNYYELLICLLIKFDIYELKYLVINWVNLYLVKNLNSMIQLNLEEKKIWVKGLAIHCPMGESMKACPANEIRLLPIPERLRNIDEMPAEGVNQIIDHHNDCLRKREGFTINWK